MKKIASILLAVAIINFQTNNFVNATPDQNHNLSDQNHNLKNISKGLGQLAKGVGRGTWSITKGTGKLLFQPIVGTGKAAWNITRSNARIAKEILKGGKETLKIIFYVLQIAAVLYGLDYTLMLATKIGLPASILNKYSFGTMFKATNQLFSSTIIPYVNAKLPAVIQTAKNLPGSAKKLHIILPRLWNKIMNDIQNAYNAYKFGKTALISGTCMPIDPNNPFELTIKT